jgi:hypothetical protein
MLLHNVVWLSEDEDSPAVSSFFRYFSRFEYALKRSGYVRQGYDSEPAVDWGRYARQIERVYTRDLDEHFEAAVTVFLSEPPRRQQLSDGGEIYWLPIEFRSRDSEAWRVLTWLRAVRNNLFHGGKFDDEVVADPARNGRLIAAGLFVIDGLLDVSPDVLARYYDNGTRDRSEDPGVAALLRELAGDP